MGISGADIETAQKQRGPRLLDSGKPHEGCAPHRQTTPPTLAPSAGSFHNRIPALPPFSAMTFNTCILDGAA